IEEIILTENQRSLKPNKTFKCSAGIYDKMKITKVKLEDFLNNYVGRKICPIPNKNCKKLSEFKFEKNDLLIFGNEDNVPNKIKDSADEFLYIPMDEKITKQCLNLATSFSIIAYEQWKG
ncbi:MAG TPA: TrmH family RNA methyltransferase, partial [Candidatus Paceibacterota bacterium]|nr:TrmH family RNA methyltransferase [Candidatus Paceibacterota bacterium]